MVEDNVWKTLEREYRERPDYFGVPTKDIYLIEEAQKILGLSFSEAYTKFLRNFGGIIADGHTVCGLIISNQNRFFNETVVEKTKFFKEVQKWPNIENWYIISDDGSGNPIGIDPEGKVWLSDHDSGFEHIKLADSFEEFLYKLHTDTLYE